MGQDGEHEEHAGAEEREAGAPHVQAAESTLCFMLP